MSQVGNVARNLLRRTVPPPLRIFLTTVGFYIRFAIKYGHLRSRLRNDIIDENGEPLPWYTYPAIEYLTGLDFTQKTVFEFGCGTGRVAAQLFAEHLPPEASYRAVDISTTMVDLARARPAPWRGRAEVSASSGSMRLDAADAAYDRFLANFVLDLLSEYQSRKAGGIACRTGRPDSVVNVPHHDIAFDVVAGLTEEIPVVEYRLPDSGHVVLEAQPKRGPDLMVGDEIDPESNEIEVVALVH